MLSVEIAVQVAILVVAVLVPTIGAWFLFTSKTNKAISDLRTENLKLLGDINTNVAVVESNTNGMRAELERQEKKLDKLASQCQDNSKLIHTFEGRLQSLERKR